MLNITYREIDKEIEEKIINIFGEWVKKYNCLHYGEGCYSIAAMLNNQPIGFISIYNRNYPEPLSEYSEAFIDVIEVDENYRTRGIATKLLRLTEAWAKKYGYHQIGSWSSDDKKEAIQMWYALDYCVSPAVMRGQSVVKEFKNKPIHGFYVAKILNPFENYHHIIEKICDEINNAFPNVSLQKIKLIRAKNGVYVYRGKLDKQWVVIKYFEKEDDKREISNYRMLNELKILTMNVIAYGISCILLEDIGCSDIWRLGKEEDLQDEAVALQLAHWYFDLHEKGSIYENLDKMYHETDEITEANLKNLCDKLPQYKDTFDYINSNLGNLNKLISEIKQTFNYNDFYWTNLLVSKDKSAAIPFDYNLLGAGFRYNDIRNVSSSLSKEAETVFLNEYNRLYEEKHGRSRNKEEFKEQRIDKVTSVLISLIEAFKRKDFPSWANSAKNSVISGNLLKAAKSLFELNIQN